MDAAFRNQVVSLLEEQERHGIQMFLMLVTDDGVAAGILTDVEDQRLLEDALANALERVRSGEHRHSRRFAG